MHIAIAVYSTVQVARIIGVNKTTLLRWLYASRVPEPRHVMYAGQDLRMWTEDDLKRAKRYKEQNYRRGRGRKKRS